MPLFDIKKNTEKKEKNLYTNIFEKKEDKKKNDSKVLSGVFAKEDKASTPKKNILGPLPELEKNLIGSFDPNERNLKIAKTILISLIGVVFLAFVFFYTELNPKFDLLTSLRGPNTAQQLNNIKNSVITTQTSINQKNYLLMSYYLQKLSYLSDGYTKIRKDTTGTYDEKNIRDSILIAYENALTKHNEPITVGNIPKETFKVQLKNELRNELNQLRTETPTASINAEIKNYTDALRLVDNKNLGKIFTHKVDDIRNDLPQDDTKLFILTRDILKNLTNDFSTISDIKLTRIQWSIIIQEIERVTKSVDTLYNTGFFEELGGLKYSSFDFDAKTNRVILTGQAKRDDGTTFTLIVNLIDALGNSPIFKDVDNRSYQKSGSEKDGYISSFRIELSLEDDYVLTKN